MWARVRATHAAVSAVERAPIARAHVIVANMRFSTAAAHCRPLAQQPVSTAHYHRVVLHSLVSRLPGIVRATLSRQSPAHA
eukprot:IDg11019t1